MSLTDTALARTERALEEARAEVERLRLRTPTTEEMNAALNGYGECFLDGWTVRRCIDCHDPVAGGPTRCALCAARAEVERLRERNEQLGAEILKARAEAHELVKHRDPNINSALRDLAHARADNERLREQISAALVTLEQAGAWTPRMSEAQDMLEAALAGSPVETRRALAERVREACAQAASCHFLEEFKGKKCGSCTLCEVDAEDRVRDLDLDALLSDERPSAASTPVQREGR